MECQSEFLELRSFLVTFFAEKKVTGPVAFYSFGKRIKRPILTPLFGPVLMRKSTFDHLCDH